ncbi:MAG: 5-formyltetrahydrofolate cyclo-ligase [Pedobacter sp.]|nr:MAG: 5-formyltetrahydrofolate cyclo-ligase [Pedobacter sp.]
MANKSDLRKQALKQRKELDEQTFAELNKMLLEQFKALGLSGIKSIHIFLPIEDKKEPNTFLIIDWLQQQYPEIEIIVPKADFATSLMSNYLFVGKADLQNNHYQIPEPQKAPLFNGIPDMVLVPLLAFDKKGYRVGYGKGFYDRFLQNIETQKIGLSLFDSVEEINDVHLSDIRLDKCVTPNGIINFNTI